MTREEAHTLLEVMAIELTGELADIECPVTERTKLLGKQLEAIDMAIEALSADTVQGEWVDLYECSVCGKQVDDFIEGFVEGIEYMPNYCPNCGARMTPYKGGDTE